MVAMRKPPSVPPSPVGGRASVNLQPDVFAILADPNT